MRAESYVLLAERNCGTQSIEVELRAIFAIGMHASHKPTFPSLQTRSRGNGSKLCACTLFNCNAIQHQFLLNDAQSIVWVAVYFVGAMFSSAFSNTPARARFGHWVWSVFRRSPTKPIADHLGFELASRVISAAFRQATAFG